MAAATGSSTGSKQAAIMLAYKTRAASRMNRIKESFKQSQKDFENGLVPF